MNVQNNKRVKDDGKDAKISQSTYGRNLENVEMLLTFHFVF